MPSIRTRLARTMTNPRLTRPLTTAFAWAYYNSAVWYQTEWLGTRTLKLPLDLWIYQEILYELRPDLILETGTAAGGSAMFLAAICDQLDHGQIVTVDIE